MSGTLLIDAVVRQTTVLLAALATSTGNRASLAHVANEVFGSLVTELKTQGVGNKVIADMFGMALRTYHDRVSRLSESQSDHGHSLWDAILAYLREHGPVLRGDVLRRFSRDEEATVRSVLRDLVASGLAARSGSNDHAVYRVTSPEEQGLAHPVSEDDAVARLLLVAVHNSGPISATDLAKVVPLAPSAVEELLDRLVAEGQLTIEERDGSVRYRHDRVLVSYGDAAGWQAAVFDHYQAMVSAICSKLRAGRMRAEPDESMGGSTYHLDVWDGHPFEQEALGLLAALRKQAIALRTRIEAHNAAHVAPDRTAAKRVVVYVGQHVLEEGSDEDD